MASDHGKIVADCSQLIYEGFVRYNHSFFRITDRARKRFEQRDWEGHQSDITARVELYEKCVQKCVSSTRKSLGSGVQQHALWNDIRDYLGARLEQVPDAGFIKTFFNSITRRIFGTVGIDKELEFVSSAPDEGFQPLESLSLKRYPYWRSFEGIFSQVFQDFHFNVPFRDADSDILFIADRIKDYLRNNYPGEQPLRLDLIDSFFYQSARAYLIGSIILKSGVSPIVIPLKNSDEGICVDAVLLNPDDVSHIFSYTRSYFFADPSSVMGAVQFLHSILPHKHIDELYTVLGRLRQGKTERYRLFSNHLRNTADKFVTADGDKGLVMLVFTLPSYNLVFKIIRDRFGYPKTISREDVIGKYKLVSKHDLAGRLIDTQEFLNLEFPVNRFDEKLLDEFRSEAANTVHIHGDQLIIDHVYIERRVRPLNLYVRESGLAQALSAIIDYGQTIKDLAGTNLFPGDLLLKNFGVTRNKRVVFYDYDEVALVTECNFRDIPVAGGDEELMNTDTWAYVDKDDIFPEELIKFLAMDGDLRAVFLKYHGDLLTPAYWQGIKADLLAGKIPIIVPYHKPENTGYKELVISN